MHKAWAFCFAMALAWPAAAGAAAGDAVEKEVEFCLGCHGEKDFTTVLANGDTISLSVDARTIGASVHGKGLRCTDCHTGMGELPHPERNVKNASEFHAGFRDVCKSCHFDKYALSLDGVHAKQLAKGNEAAPGCLDCHGAHDVAPAGKPRTRISDTCAACHPDVADTYMNSVHGKALAAGNLDVPVCIDCHRAHDISDPRVTSWIVKTPELCARCHTDAAKMGKYGLSTNVVQSYLADFHGVTASTSRARTDDAQGGARVTALCIDCHGVHDITKADAANSPVLRANLVKTCRKCHPTASESFPDAWLSHYEPSWKRAPMVYAVKVFYMVFIPFIIGGLVLQVMLHLWRVVVNR
jgi:predicted CXXCH cytochrome family protein